MKLKNIQIFATIFVVIFSIIYLIFSYSTYTNLNKSLIDSSEKTMKYTKLLNEVRYSQVAFQVQIQEFKSILIQGNDPERWEYRNKKYNDQIEKTASTLNNINDQMTELSFDNKFVLTTLTNHKQMNEKYQEALLKFDKEDPNSGKYVDSLVRDIYKSTFTSFSELSEYIAEESANKMKNESDLQVSQSESKFKVMFLSLVINSLIIIATIYMLVNYIIKMIGSEPTDIKDYFENLSNGDFSEIFEIDENDESSLAAKLVVMHLRVKSLVKNLKKGALEIESITEKININSSTEDVRKSFINVKQVVKSISSASSKIKV